ncbi:MAG: NADH-quinone oxidoreductase subunit L [Myxococcota bacterium]
MNLWDESVSASLIRWIAILPLASAIVHGFLIGLARVRISDRSVWAISLSAVTASFGVALLSLFDLVGAAASLPILDSLGPWIGGGVGTRNFSAELTFQFDPLSAVFSVAVTAIAIFLYAYTIGILRSGLMNRELGHRTFATLDLMVGSMMILLLADNLLLFFLGWAGVGIASQLFSAFHFEAKTASRAGATTFVIGRVGDLGLLASILLIFDGLSRAGAPTLTFRGIEAAFRLLEESRVDWLAWGEGAGPALFEVVAFGLVLAAMTKCAQLPLHFWLPGATEGPAAATAMMQSATTVVAGSYVLLRFSFLLPSAPIAMQVLAWAGGATMVLASLAAATQFRLPRLIAFATSSQLGLIVLAIGLGAYSSATYLLLAHAFVKANLILGFGFVIYTLKGETDIRKMGGLAQRMRWTQGYVALAGLALVGCPPLAGFFPLEEVLAFVQITYRPKAEGIELAILASNIVLAFALARAYFLVFWGNVRPGGLVEQQLQDPGGWTQHSLTGLTILTCIVGVLTPSQFWNELILVNSKQLDSVGHFLSSSIAGAPDPGLGGAERWTLITGVIFSMTIGVLAAFFRYAKRGYRGESKHAAVRVASGALREMFYVEEAFYVLLVRPLRWVSRIALVGGIETRLIDRTVVTGGSSLVRRFVWSVPRRLQNGRLQSYALIGLLTLIVVISWMVS